MMLNSHRVEDYEPNELMTFNGELPKMKIKYTDSNFLNETKVREIQEAPRIIHETSDKQLMEEIANRLPDI